MLDKVTKYGRIQAIMSNLTDFRLNMNWVKISPVVKSLGVVDDYYAVYKRIMQEFNTTYLFESLAIPSKQDRYITLGFDPCLTISASETSIEVICAKEYAKSFGLANLKTVIPINKASDAFDFLKLNFKLHKISRSHEGGLVGYFSYESFNCFEEAISLAVSKEWGYYQLGLYLDGLIYDNLTGEMTYFNFGVKNRFQVCKKILKESKATTEEEPLDITYLGDSLTRDEHVRVVEQVKQEIAVGNTFQCEVGLKSNYTVKGNPEPVYEKLRVNNPSPYMYYMRFDEKSLIGASPELLVASVNRRVITTPTAGTTKRGENDHEDRVLAYKLLHDEKEVSEHNMIVDLHRNDISKVCIPGSVRVNDLKYVIKFKYVQHIVSDVIGELDSHYTGFDLLAAILPGGVLNGAPKIESVKIIARNEKLPRGPYGGAVGRFSMNGDMAFCLPIRSLFISGEDGFTQTSGGIVYDSKAENEYEEIQHKLRAMRTTLTEVGSKEN